MLAALFTTVLLQQQALGLDNKADDLPLSIGIMGVGTIGSAVVRGLLGAPAGHLPHVPSFVLFDTNTTKTENLKKEFPTSDVTIANNNQQLLDKAACVVIALPGSVAEPVIKSLMFSQGQQVISLVAAIKYPILQQILGPSVDATVAVPLPAVAKRQGATLGIPPKPFANAVFTALGTYTAVTDLDQFVRMESAAAFMGDFYKRQLTIQQWLGVHG
jgi:pyrroline-5-carboxylate reductase